MKYIGIMTGNSLDAADLVLTSVTDGKFQDLCFYSKPYPLALTQLILQLREKVKALRSDMSVLKNDEAFSDAINFYTKFVADAVNDFLSLEKIDRSDIRAIGFHGQTLDHFPPSVAGQKEPYTLQIGNAQMLADQTGIPVVFDFRSDDIFNGGEGAPLAPMHNFHLGQALLQSENDAVAFCNAGNTGNIAVVTSQGVSGWDVGPFNHFPDLLCRKFWNKSCDENGLIGQKGTILLPIVQKFYEASATTDDGSNFYQMMPPKSSDPAWYNLPEGLDDFAPEDILRSAEYFSAYNFVLSLRFLKIKQPITKFVLFGGGWKNPNCLEDFKAILCRHELSCVLPEHEMLFSQILKNVPEVHSADVYGISGQYMEARIFADLAHSFFEKIPFTTPQITGAEKEVVCGVLVQPFENNNQLWSRAAKGWKIQK